MNTVASIITPILKSHAPYLNGIIDLESKWNPKAVSGSGFVGLTQMGIESLVDVVTRFNFDDRFSELGLGDANAFLKSYKSMTTAQRKSWLAKSGKRNANYALWQLHHRLFMELTKTDGTLSVECGIAYMSICKSYNKHFGIPYDTAGAVYMSWNLGIGSAVGWFKRQVRPKVLDAQVSMLRAAKTPQQYVAVVDNYILDFLRSN